jgi:2-oxoglutarate decarboxylase
MTVAMPSEPANYFHLLRRHAMDGVRRPMIVFTPKSLLRNKEAVSPLEDFTSGKFRSVIDDPTLTGMEAPVDQVRRIVLCTGKIYYELAAEQAKRGITDTAIVRLEQLYPLPKRRLIQIVDRYPAADDIRWVQEEPANQGAWPFLGLALAEQCPERMSHVRRVSRRRMAAPAAGSSRVHEVEQAAIIAKAFDEPASAAAETAKEAAAAAADLPD